MSRNIVPLKKSTGQVTGENWAIIIGISHYEDSTLNLNYAHKDAEDLYNLLLKSNGGFFNQDNVQKLLNEDASFNNIRRALRNFLKKPGRDDLVLVYFSCHGGIDPERPLITYLLPYDTKCDDIATSGLPMREIGDSIRENILSQKIIIIADACHSAAIGEAMVTRNVNSSSAYINKYLNDLANSTGGIALFTSAEANEVAFEDKRWGDGHGVFTHFLLEGIRGNADGYGGGEKDGVISIGELFEYVRDNVKESTDRKQHPSIGTTPYDRNLPLAITSYTINNSATSTPSPDSGNLTQKERLDSLSTLLKNGQVDEFNAFRKKDDLPMFLPNIDLSEKNLPGIDLQDATLSKSNFRKTNLHGANLSGAILTRADMSEADLSSAILSGSILREAKLIGTDLRGTEIKGMIDFSRADLSHANLRGVNLEGIVNFENAKLYDIDFTSVNRESVLLYLKGADIRNATSLTNKSQSSNKYLDALQKFSKNLSDLFNKFNIALDGKRSVEDAVNQLVNVAESIPSFDVIKDNEKITLNNKIRNLVQEIVKALPLEIQVSPSISNSFLDLSPFNKYLDESKKMSISELFEYEFIRVKTPQDAFALNRAGYSKKAEKILKSLIENQGASSEAYGILGRVYKDRWEREYKLENDENSSIHYLDQAIEAYLKGFQTDLHDPYPGINAITLMELRNPPDPRRKELLPVVKYSIQLKMAKGKPDYWDYATLLELAILTRDKKTANSLIPKVLSNLNENWKGETTLRNLRILREARERRNESVLWTKQIEARMKKKLNAI